MNDNFQAVLQELFNAEAKRSVFASFSQLRDIPTGGMDAREEKLRYEQFVKKLQSSPFFKAAKDGGVSMLTVKEMMITSFKKQSDELLLKLAKGFDLAIVDKK